MLDFLLDQINGLVTAYGSTGVFLAAFIEEVAAPIPSVLVLMSAGLGLMSGAELNLASFWRMLFVMALPAAGGLTLGSLVFYYFGIRFGKAFVDRWGKYFALKWSHIEKAEAYFEKGLADELGLFFARLLPIVPNVAIALLSGVFRIKLWKYLLITFLGSLGRALVLGFIGWQAGVFYRTYAKQFQIFEEVIFGVIILIAAYFLIKTAVKKRKR